MDRANSQLGASSDSTTKAPKKWLLDSTNKASNGIIPMTRNFMVF